MSSESSSGRLNAFEAEPMETRAAAATSRSVALEAPPAGPDLGAPASDRASPASDLAFSVAMFGIESFQVSVGK
jgi:hypothetical protein